MQASKDPAPVVFSYLSYQGFLRDYFDHLKQEMPGFSLTSFCRKNPELSKQSISMILNGKRKLPAKHVSSMALGLKLAPRERRYFEGLVQFNHAESGERKELLLRELVRSQPQKHAANLSEQAYGILYSWHCLVILELMKLPAFRGTGKWISSRLRGRLSVVDANRALRTLVDLGLVAQNPSGKLFVKANTVRTADEVRSLAIQKYHRECLLLGERVLREAPVESREFGSINMVLTPASFRLLKEKIKSFREEALELAEADPKADAFVAQLNLQLFNLEG